MNTDSIKRKIRKLLHLAADGRGNKSQAEAARVLARRLMKQNGWKEDDVREPGDQMPGDVRARLILKGDKNYDAHQIVSTIVCAHLKNSVTIEHRSAIVGDISIIDARGAREQVAEATRLWETIYRFIGQEWHAAEMSFGANSALPAFFGSKREKKADEFSWLTGVLQGYCSAEAQEMKWAATMRDHEERLLIKAAPKKRKKKFKPAPFNPLAVMCVPKPAVAVREDLELEGEEVPAVVHDPCPLNAARHPPDDQPKGARQLDEWSWRLGYKCGEQLYAKMPAIQKNGTK